MPEQLTREERKKAIRNAGIAVFVMFLPWILLGLAFMSLFLLLGLMTQFGF